MDDQRRIRPMAKKPNEVILRGLPETSEDYKELERELIRIFTKEIYAPILGILRELNITIKNQSDDLHTAILKNKIYYSRGGFHGRFSAKISKELKGLGAKWDNKTKSWRIPLAKLPITLRSTISVSVARFDEKLKAIDEKLAKVNPKEVTDKVRIQKILDHTIFRTEKDFQKQIDNITVVPQVSAQTRAFVAKTYTDNLELYVTKFTEEEIAKLRKMTEENVFKGNRYDTLAKEIKESFNVTENKAKFLARQESMLMLTAYKQARYEQAGSESYIWQCVVGSPKHPVRPMHKIHDRKEYRWDAPPVIDEKGNRGHPGTAYNCRCVSRPVIRFK